jgi:hypothetical protein
MTIRDDHTRYSTILLALHRNIDDVLVEANEAVNI